MHIKVVHFLFLSRVFANYTLFKCHKHIVKSSIWQKKLWIKIFNLNKNIYWKRNSINIHQSYSNGLLKWAYGLWFGFYISIQMHFLLWFHSIFSIRTQYIILDRKTNMNWKKLQQKLEPTNNYGLLNDQIWTLFS